MDIKETKIDKDKYGSDTLYYHLRSGVYSFEKEIVIHEVFTVFTKDKDCKRGEYREEIDVAVPSRVHGTLSAAKRVAQAALDYDYEPGLWWSRAVRRIHGVMYF